MAQLRSRQTNRKRGACGGRSAISSAVVVLHLPTSLHRNSISTSTTRSTVFDQPPPVRIRQPTRRRPLAASFMSSRRSPRQMSLRSCGLCWISNVRPLRCGYSLERSMSTSWRLFYAIYSTGHSSTAPSCRASSPPTSHRILKRQTWTRPTCAHTGRSLTCRSSPSCLSELYQVNL